MNRRFPLFLLATLTVLPGCTRSREELAISSTPAREAAMAASLGRKFRPKRSLPPVPIDPAFGEPRAGGTETVLPAGHTE